MKTNQFKLLKISTLFLFILFVTQSCTISSLHPLYTYKDRVHKEELNGSWVDSKGNHYEVTTHIERDVSETLEWCEQKNVELLESDNIDSLDLKKKILNNEKTMNVFNNAKKFPRAKLYRIAIIQKKDTTIFQGRLSKLGEYYFLDVIPDGDDLIEKLDDELLVSLVAPMHGFFKIQFSNNELKLNWLETGVMEQLAQEKKIRLKYMSTDDREIITATTSDIQKFLIKFADTKMFNDPKEALILKRVKN